MARVVVFGPHKQGDSALENSRWIAAQHVEHLGEMAFPVIDGEAVRATLERAVLEPSVEGVVLCGHGDGGKEVFVRCNQHHDRDEQWHRRCADTSDHGAVYGSDGEAAFDHANVGLAVHRWIHVLACEVGMSEIPHRAVSHGVIAFAAYEQRLVPEFTASTLPDSAASILRRIVTWTTARMAERQFEAEILVREVRRASEALYEWFDSEEGASWAEGPGASEQVGLTKFAMQLSTALRVVVRSSVPPVG